MRRRTQSWSVRWFIARLIWPFRWHLLGIIGIVAILSFDQSFRPYLIKQLLNSFECGSTDVVVPRLILIATIFCITLIVVMIVQRLHDWIMLRMEPLLKEHITEQLMSYAMGHTHAFYQGVMSGSLSTRIIDVAKGIPQLIEMFVTRWIETSLTILIAILAIMTVHSIFGVLLGVWVVIFLLIAMSSAKTSRKLSDASADARALVTGTLSDTIANMVSVRLFGGYHHEQLLLRERLAQATEAERARDWHLLKVKAFQIGSFILLEIVNFAILIRGYQEEWITPGDFAFVLMINGSLLVKLWALAQEMSKFMKTFGEVSNGIYVVTAPHQIVDAPHAKKLVVTDGKIVFEQVTFYYPSSEKLFDDLSVVIEPGEKIGLVGYSGSGKSTFVNLILRLYEIQSGTISIDGQNIALVTQDSLRKAIALIPQDPILFHRSLRDNIVYGNVDASDEEVAEAVRLAHADEFIAKFPGGYGAAVGERGLRLSGGQRQRIAIARAFLKKAPILLLDEATSALDSITEIYIQDSLHQLMEGRTTLVVAHRLSTLMRMDRILVFDQGKIVEDGSHADLIQRQGLYNMLWNSQVEGFIPDHHQKGG